MLVPKVSVTGYKEMLNALKEADAKLPAMFRKEMRERIAPIAKKIESNFPKTAPMSGFNNDGRTGWSPMKASISITPGRSKKYPKRQSLVSIVMTAKKYGGLEIAGPAIAELAGSRSSGETLSGVNMIKVLNQRAPMVGAGGRFMYKAFRKERPEAVRIADEVINKYAAMVDKKVQ